MLFTRMTTLPFLLLVLSHFVIFDSDYELILCLLCKSKALWNIFMILVRNVEQDKTTCHMQQWQLWLSFFWSYLPFLYLTLLVCPLRNLKAIWIILILLGRNEEQDKMMCCIQKWQLWLSYFWSYLPTLCFNLISCLLCYWKTSSQYLDDTW